MAFVATAPNAYLAEELARFVDLPNAYRGQRLKVIPADANISKNGVVYFPFESEKEVGEWMERATCEWWDDETI